jgi:hypothetical protein
MRVYRHFAMTWILLANQAIPDDRRIGKRHAAGHHFLEIFIFVAIAVALFGNPQQKAARV